MEGQLSTVNGRQMTRCRDELQQSPWVIRQGKQGAGGISKWYLGVCTYILAMVERNGPRALFLPSLLCTKVKASYIPQPTVLHPYRSFFSIPAHQDIQDMASRVTRDFPLESMEPGDTGFDTAPGVSSGTEGGASGYSGGPMLSTGGLVAIVVVVVVVTIIGGSSPSLHVGDGCIANKSQSQLQHCSSLPRGVNGP